MLKRKEITKMEIVQEFVVEYGCYGNYTTAIIKDIRPTDYPQIKIVIPKSHFFISLSLSFCIYYTTQTRICQALF